MSYRCELCKAAVPKSTPRKTYPETRKDGSTKKEWWVCWYCHHLLTDGVPLATVYQRGKPKPMPDPTAPIVVQAQAPLPVSLGTPARPDPKLLAAWGEKPNGAHTEKTPKAKK